MSSRSTWALVGMASSAVAIGVGEVVAGVLNSTSPIAAVGALVIALQPPWGKDLMTSLFGTNDKLALEIAVFIGGVLLGALLGLVGRIDRRLAFGGIVVAGVAAFVLILQDPLEDTISAIVTAGAAVAAGVAMFQWLATMIDPEPVPVVKARAVTRGTAVAVPRRAFLGIAAMFVAVGAVLSVIGR